MQQMITEYSNILYRYIYWFVKQGICNSVFSEKLKTDEVVPIFKLGTWETAKFLLIAD